MHQVEFVLYGLPKHSATTLQQAAMKRLQHDYISLIIIPEEPMLLFREVLYTDKSDAFMKHGMTKLPVVVVTYDGNKIAEFVGYTDLMTIRDTVSPFVSGQYMPWNTP